MARTILGFFDNLADADGTVAELRSFGVADSCCSVVVYESQYCLPDRAPHTKPLGPVVHGIRNPGSALCVTAGCVAGGIGGLFLTLVLMGIPGLNIEAIAFAGPALALLSGAVGGAVLGGVIAALICASRREESKVHSEIHHAEGALVSVTVPDEETEKTVAIFSAHHVSDLNDRDPESQEPASVDHTSYHPRERVIRPLECASEREASIYTNPERSTSARIYNP